MDTARWAPALAFLLLLVASGAAVTKADINDPCESLEDCNAVEHSSCINNVCKCNNGFINSGTTECLPVATEYGDVCKIDEQCFSLGALLISCSSETNTCICPQNFHYVDNECWFGANLGGVCTNSKQCLADNSACNGFLCRCIDGYNPKDDKCVVIGEPCESTEVCGEVENFECIENVCQCKDGFVNGDTAKCVPVVDYEEDCEVDAQCFHLTPNQNSISCSPTEHKCLCPTDYHYIEQRCWADTSLGQGCTNTLECVVTHAACLDNACSCTDGYEQEGNICVVEKPHCELIPGAIETDDGQCECEDHDNIIDSKHSKCVRVAFEGYGSECEDILQCRARMGDGASCQGSKCSCEDGYHYLHGRCWNDAGFGDECSEHAECYAHGESDAYACVEDLCACAADAEAKRPGDSPLCRRIARENEECESQVDCDEGLLCNKPVGDPFGTTCSASRSHSVYNASVLISNGAPLTQLLHRRARSAKRADPRNDCGYNEEPTPSGNECVCQHGFFRPTVESPCVPELGEPCRVGEDLEEPHIDFAVCRRSAKFPYEPPTAPDDDGTEDGVWACLGGLVASSNNRECDSSRGHRNICQAHAQCGHYGGLCVFNNINNNNGLCECESKYAYVTDRLLCWPTVGLDKTCMADEVCVVETPDSTECDFGDSAEAAPEGTCRCKSGYIVRGDDCVEDVTLIGDSCESKTDCSDVENTDCIENICKCEEDFVSSGTRKCVPVAKEYGDDCEVDEQCSSLGALLISCSIETNTCTCPQNFHYVDNECWIDANLGGVCTNNKQCIAENSACVGSFCRCIDGYEPEDNTCVAEPSPCDLIQGAIETEDGECECEDHDYIIDSENSRCVRVAFEGYGSECEDSLQCQARMSDGATCQDSKCSCEEGYHYLHGRCWKDAGFGDECSEHAECYAFAQSDAYACVEDLCACAADAEPKRPGDSPVCRRIARENEECESHVDCDEGLLCNKPDDDALDTNCLASRSHNIIYNVSANVNKNASIVQRQGARYEIRAGARADCGDNEESTPSGNECVCLQGFFRSTAESPCVPELGEPCWVGKDPEIQDIEHAVCRRSAKFPYVSPTLLDDNDVEDGVWACLGGFVAASNNRECDEAQQYASSCQNDVQCGHLGGICSTTNECECEANYNYVPGKLLCWPWSRLNEPCVSDEVCVVDTPDSTECDFSEATEDDPDGICRCKGGYRENGADCLKSGFQLDEDCIDETDCIFADGDLSVTCRNGKCACSEGYTEFNKTICDFDLTPKCEFITGAIEEDGKCVCKDRDYIMDGSLSICIPMALEGYGAECEVNAQCLNRMAQGAGCVTVVIDDVEVNQCQCLEGFHYLHGQCWPDKGFGDACSVDAECYAYAETDPYACVEGVCACAADAEPKRPGTNPICRRTARDGEECESKLDCIEGLVCDQPDRDALDTICQVQSSSRTLNNSTYAAINTRFGRPPLQRRQLATPELHSADDARAACGPNEQLTPNRACMCQRGYYRPTASSACVPELGEPCWVGDDAALLQIEYAICRRSAKFPYEPSTSTEPSETPNGVWACLGGFVAAPSNRECEKTRTINFNCQVDAQCGFFGGTCNGRSCVCETGHHYVNVEEICWPTKGLYEVCEIDADCGVATADSVYCELSTSSEGTCQCKTDYHAVSGDCRRKAYQLNERCTGDIDCVFAVDDPTIYCDYGYCSCRSGYFTYNDTACQLGVTGPCSSTPGCTVEHTICLDQICQCSAGYVRSGYSRCIPVATEYEEECEEEEQCTALTPGQEYITCSYPSYTCQCWPGMHYRERACWTTKLLDEKCAYQSECIADHSRCMNNYCTCDLGYIADGKDKCKDNAAPSAVMGSLIALVLVALASQKL